MTTISALPFMEEEEEVEPMLREQDFFFFFSGPQHQGRNFGREHLSFLIISFFDLISGHQTLRLYEQSL